MATYMSIKFARDAGDESATKRTRQAASASLFMLVLVSGPTPDGTEEGFREFANVDCTDIRSNVFKDVFPSRHSASIPGHT